MLVPVHKHESRNSYLNKYQYQLHQALQEIAPVFTINITHISILNNWWGFPQNLKGACVFFSLVCNKRRIRFPKLLLSCVKNGQPLGWVHHRLMLLRCVGPILISNKNTQNNRPSFEVGVQHRIYAFAADLHRRSARVDENILFYESKKSHGD